MLFSADSSLSVGHVGKKAGRYYDKMPHGVTGPGSAAVRCCHGNDDASRQKWVRPVIVLRRGVPPWPRRHHLRVQCDQVRREEKSSSAAADVDV